MTKIDEANKIKKEIEELQKKTRILEAKPVKIAAKAKPAAKEKPAAKAKPAATSKQVTQATPKTT